MEFQFRPVMQYKNTFAGNIISKNGVIGGMGKDEEGVYLNLNSELPLNEMAGLLSYIVNSSDLGREKIKIQYVEDSK